MKRVISFCPVGLMRAASCVCSFVLLSLIAPIVALAGATQTAQLKGTVYTIGTDKVQTVWPNARVTLKNTKTQAAVSTVTSDLGEYSFSGVEPGEYELTVTLAGFEVAVYQAKLDPKADMRLDIELRPKKQTEEVVVKGQTQGVDVTTTEIAGPTLTQNILQSMPVLNDHFQDALPLLPGIVRGPDGLINIKGGRANQSTTRVNSASVLDPVTGQEAISLPIEAVGSVKVLSNPFSAEYGRFAGGVVDVETRSGTDEWKALFTNFFPRPRVRGGHIVGLESITPRITAAGPLVRSKLYAFQSFDYRFVRNRVASLPDLQNDQVTETFDSYTQFDWNINANNRFTVSASVSPQNLQFVNMNTFNPENVSPDYRQRGYFVAAQERAIFSNGGFLETGFSVKRFDAHFFPARLLASELDLFSEQNFGTYFNRQDRSSHVYQGAQTYHFRPLNGAGSHLIEVGYYYGRLSYDGTLTNLPVLVLREPTTPGANCAADVTHTICTRSQLITYSGTGVLSATKNDLAFFFQDRWQLHKRFTLDYGIRFDRDDLSKDAINVAPRVGFVFAPTRDNKTAIRGGVGLFYDKIPLDVSTFLAYPAQIITRYAADGTTIVSGPTTFTHVIATPDGRVHVPYSLGWDFQVDREIRRGLLFRFGYEERQTHRDFLVDPVETLAELHLLNSGRQSYREFQWTARWEANRRTTLFLSFVRSRATGDLNSFDQFFGNYPNPVIRPNQFGRLPYDAPNRFLLWGTIGLPWKLEFSPLLEVRNGFPFSKVDNDLNFIGQRNTAGRFPVFTALDVLVARPFDIPVFKKKYHAKVGLRVHNVANHDNPRDVQQNVFSPNFGHFFNSVGRQFRGKFEFEF
ncbi:MAG TPA: TonB-dependent receptor [Candidatus Acidoferrales bacterium]|nr:TonB-dependent receptor [Candidatus Acidoferrales bacterium]